MKPRGYHPTKLTGVGWRHPRARPGRTWSTFTALPASVVLTGVNGVADRPAPRHARAACWLVVVIVGAFWAPTIWRSSLLNWHIQTGYAQLQFCDWPAWQEGFSTTCTHGEWFYRLLERRAIKLPSALWTSGAAYTLGSGPLFYGGLWLVHVVSSALVQALALRATGHAGLAVLAALLFGLHPATAEVVVTGQFSQYALGGCFSLLALWLALRGAALPILAGALALACLSDVTFLATPLIVLLWAPDPRRVRLACAGVLVLAAVAHGVHGELYPSRHHHHAVIPPVSFGDRLFRTLVAEPVLALRRLLLLWLPDSGPWHMDPRTHEFADGLGPLGPLPLAWLASLIAGAVWLVRRDLGAVVRLGAVPIALLLVDVCARAGWSDILASRWSGLRQTYLPAAFLALTIAWCLRRVTRRRVAVAVGVVLLSWPAWLSWQFAARAWNRMDADQRVFLAAAARMEALAIPPSATAYLFQVADARPFSMWQGTLRDRVGGAHFTVITHSGASTAPTRFTRTGPHELELELCAECADFLRLDRQQSWAGPVDPSQRLAHYLRRGGQLNMWPIFDPGVLAGHRVPVPGVEGADVRVLSIEPDRPVRLALRTRHPLDDPRTVLLVEQHSGWARVSCPSPGACLLAPPAAPRG